MLSIYKKLLKGFWICLVVVGCSPPAPIPPTPTIEPLRLQIAPSQMWLVDDLNNCLVEQNSPGILLLETSADSIRLESADMAITTRGISGYEQNTFQLAEQSLRVVVNPQNPVSDFSSAQWVQILTGNITTWDEITPELSGDIHLWVYSEQDEIWGTLRRVPGFPAEIRGDSIIAPDPEWLRASIATDPLAIGILPTTWLDSTVTSVSVDGIKELATSPILAITSEDPQGSLKDLIICLQSRLD